MLTVRLCEGNVRTIVPIKHGAFSASNGWEQTAGLTLDTNGGGYAGTEAATTGNSWVTHERQRNNDSAAPSQESRIADSVCRWACHRGGGGERPSECASRSRDRADPRGDSPSRLSTL